MMIIMMIVDRRGTNGVSTNEVTANLVFLLTEDLLGTLVNLLLYSQKCQGDSFLPIRSKLITFAAAH